MSIHEHVQWVGPSIFIIFSKCMLFHLVSIKQIYVSVKKTPSIMILVRPTQSIDGIEPV